MFQKQLPEVFYKAVLENFAIFTGKHLSWSFFLIKFQTFRPVTKTHEVFSYEYCEFSRMQILKDICKRLLLVFQSNKKSRVGLLLVNDTHRKKLCITQFSTRMAAWRLLTFFICLHNQLNSIHSLITYQRYRCLKKVIHQIDSKNE